MPFNGNGTFVLPDPPLEAGEIVSADEHNTTRDDMATGFTNCVTRDGQSPAVANLPMGTYKHTNVGASNSLTNYARTDQVQNDSFHWLTSVSGTNTITAATGVAPAAYAAGQRFAFVPANDNTGPATININSLGAKSIKLNGTDDVYAGFLSAGTVYTLIYDGTAFQVATGRTSGIFHVERFSGDGSETEFTLSHSAISENYLLVYIYGVYQQKDTYTFSGNTLTFSSPPPIGTDNIEVVISSTLALGETDASQVEYTFPVTGAVTTNVEAKLAQTVSVKDFGGDANDAIAAAIENFIYLTDNTENILITVGASGDFATINEAIEQATRMRPLYKSNGVVVEIKLLSGFVMEEQVIADGIDLSFIKLSSEDLEVTIDRASLTQIVYGIDYPAFSAINNGTLPLIDVLFSMNTTGSRINRSGVFAVNGGRVVFNFVDLTKTKGIKNAGSRGIHAQHGSIVVARACDFSGALEIGVRCASGSIVAMRDAVVTGCGANPAPGEGSGGCANGGGILYAQGVDFSDAIGTGASCISGTIDLLEATVNDSSGRGISIRRGSIAEIQGAVCTGSGEHGLYVEGSVVNASGIDVSDSTDVGIYAASGAFVNAPSAVIDNCDIGIQAFYSSTVEANNASIVDATTYGVIAIANSNVDVDAATITGAGTDAINAEKTCTINAVDAVCTGSGRYGISTVSSKADVSGADFSNSTSKGIYASDNSCVNAQGVTVDSCGGNAVEIASASEINLAQGSVQNAVEAGVVVIDGSNANCRQTNATGAGTYGFQCLRGSTINASAATGTVSKTVNTLTNDGIIFQ